MFLLLKSSDFIVHDLDYGFEGCADSDGIKIDNDSPPAGAAVRSTESPYELVLRKWYDYETSMEFRCFLFENRLIGTFLLWRICFLLIDAVASVNTCTCYSQDAPKMIAVSQRDTSNYYDFLIPMKNQLLPSIFKFITKSVTQIFPIKNCK